MIKSHSCCSPRCIRSQRLFLPRAVGLDLLRRFPLHLPNFGFWSLLTSLSHIISALSCQKCCSIGPWLTQIPMQLPPLPLTSYQNTSRLLLFLLFNTSPLHQVLHPDLWLCEVLCISFHLIMRQSSNCRFLFVHLVASAREES